MVLSLAGLGYVGARALTDVSAGEAKGGSETRPYEIDRGATLESRPLVVVGAGVAGTAAAIEAARAGVQVTLIDENPISLSTMDMDVPLFFGRRIAGELSDRAVMLERVIAANDGLARAVDAGVDLCIGTCVWGAFRNSEEQQSPRRPATRSGRRQAVMDAQVRPAHIGDRGA